MTSGMWKNSILNLLFPPKCVFCGVVMEAMAAGLCSDCAAELPRARCREDWPEGVARCMSVFEYTGLVKSSFHRYKFGHMSAYGQYYGRLMAQRALEEGERDFDLITWVPLSQARLKKRGYDQARLLAQEVGRCLGVEALPLLRKVVETAEQSSLDEEQRKVNVLGAYEVMDRERLVGKRILLIDDVVTTGATLSECALCLRGAGAAQVSALTLAQAVKKRK